MENSKKMATSVSFETKLTSKNLIPFLLNNFESSTEE